MAGSQYEKVIAAEWLVVMAVQTADALNNSAGGSKLKLPQPARYVATMLVYLSLAAVAMFGDRPGKLAAAFGGVAAIGIVVMPGPGGKQPPILAMLGYVNNLVGGTQQSTQASAPANAGTAPMIQVPQGTGTASI